MLILAHHQCWAGYVRVQQTKPGGAHHCSKEHGSETAQKGCRLKRGIGALSSPLFGRADAEHASLLESGQLFRPASA